MAYCSECGSKNESTLSKCSNCGEFLIKEEHYNADTIKGFKNLLSQTNFEKIKQGLTIDDYHIIIENIASTGIKNLNKILIADNLSWNELEILDKIKLITASYAK